MNRYVKHAAAVLIAVLVAVPMFAARGSANFSRLVILGDSTGAGFESSSLNERHQRWSVGAILARQVGIPLCAPGAAASANCFAQPLVSFPGLGPELLLNSLVPSPVIAPAPGQGAPLMNTFGRPFNNLSIPGATVGALLGLTGGETPAAGEPTAVSMARFILRNQGTAVSQAIALNPTFILVWIGNNDALNVAFSGNPATLTSATDFRTRYEALLNALVAGAPNAGMVVGTIPTSVLPYLRLVPPMLVDPATGQPVPGPNGQPIFYIVADAAGNITQTTATTLIPLQTRAKLAQGYGLPPAFRNIPPFNALPHVGEPLSADDVITAEELATVVARIGEYNAIIRQLAAARDIPVADVGATWERLHNGVNLGPVTISGAPVSGGFYSLDFIHPTDLGYLLLTNTFIRTINSSYDAGVPVASITQLFEDNGAFFGDGTPGPRLTFTTDDMGMTNAALKQIMQLWAKSATSGSRRFRAVGH